MLDNANIRKDFPMLQKTMQSHPLVYLDSGATTLKPRQVIDAVVNYYENYGANAHRGDYDLSYFVDQEYEQTRKDVAAFLHAADAREIVYTSGASSALNLVAYGYGRKFLQRGDIILTSVAEHASCVLPWMRVAQECGAVVQYVPLDAQGRITLEAVASMMNERVRVVALAHISNVLGYLAPMREICELAHRYGAVVVVDGAQSVPHIPRDVVAMDCDFLAFSAHKMCGPTGIGILYGKLELLDAMDPLYLGGDSNARFDMCGNIQLKNAPYKFESGTQPIEGIFGLHAALQYIQSIGRKNIHAWEMELHDYAIRELRRLDNIEVYNPDADTGIITFNVKNVFAQDAATFFNANGIAVRSGQHCAKLLNNMLDTSATIRASFYLYTSYADVDRFLDVCRRATMEACLDVFF